MHEVDMTKALLVTLQDWWAAQPGQPQVTQVHLIVGQFAGVEPTSLQFAFETQKTHHAFLAEAQLVIRETPLIGFCFACQAEYHPAIGVQYSCPTCRSPLEDIRSGRELKIDRLEYHLEEHLEDQTIDSARNLPQKVPRNLLGNLPGNLPTNQDLPPGGNPSKPKSFFSPST